MPASPQPWSWIQRRLREMAPSANPTPPDETEQAALVAAVEWRYEWQERQAQAKRDANRLNFVRFLRDTGRIGG